MKEKKKWTPSFDNFFLLFVFDILFSFQCLAQETVMFQTKTLSLENLSWRFLNFIESLEKTSEDLNAKNSRISFFFELNLKNSEYKLKWNRSLEERKKFFLDKIKKNYFNAKQTQIWVFSKHFVQKKKDSTELWSISKKFTLWRLDIFLDKNKLKKFQSKIFCSFFFPIKVFQKLQKYYQILFISPSK